ncbi:MAG: PorP/SprF family type IX secretion system membrane protein [Bacteroidales bacterium]|nr:PorP/SprF family type IX secretion system membrane protein [Bacteroidales bacterium]
MMKQLRYFLLAAMSIWLSRNTSAQQFPMTDHYLVNPYSLTPATAGGTDKGALFFNYRKDWLDFGKFSPETMRFNTHFHIGANLFLGAEAFMDKVDILERFKGLVSLTYRLEMTENQFLHFGIWGSGYQNTVRVDNINGNIYDPLFRNLDQLNGTTYNGGFGLVYYHNLFETGLGMPTLFRTKDAYYNQSQGRFAFEQEFLFHIANRFIIGTDWSLKPMLVARRTTNTPTIVDLSAQLSYADKFWISALYRNSQVVALGVGGELFNSMNFHYSYELGIGGIHHYGGGSHEITIGFRFGQYQQAEATPRQPKPGKHKNKRYMLHEYQQMYEQKYRRN